MTEYIIWLQSALGAGSIRAVGALKHFGSAERIYNATESEREKSGMFTQGELKRLKSTKISSARDILADCEKYKIDIITYGSENYPYSFTVLENPPLVLYVRGRLPDTGNIPAICIVGPRKVSEYGKKASYSLSYRLAQTGFVIVSGGAVGSDYHAHLGALRAGGKTVLIMGCGIECGYLPDCEPLRKCVSDNGCVLSEYPPLVKPSKASFPVRNRLLSALSLGTVVIEAREKSGSLITANCALEQGKDVFVIPGQPNAENYIGSNALLRDGAKPLLDVSDILNEYIPRFPEKIDVAKAYEKIKVQHKDTENVSKTAENTEEKPRKKEVRKNLLNKTLSKEAKIVYNYLDKHKFYPDSIVGTELSANEILSALVELEIEGIIRSLPGGLYEIIE